MLRVKATPDWSDKWLDKQRVIEDNDGWKRTVDGFYVTDVHGRTAEVMFWKYDSETKARINMMKKNKRVSTTNGEITISICGHKYLIGTYEES